MRPEGRGLDIAVVNSNGKTALDAILHFLKRIYATSMQGNVMGQSVLYEFIKANLTRIRKPNPTSSKCDDSEPLLTENKIDLYIVETAPHKQSLRLYKLHIPTSSGG